MAFIKKYNPSTDKWEIISSTNAAAIYTKDESLLEMWNCRGSAGCRVPFRKSVEATGTESGQSGLC